MPLFLILSATLQKDENISESHQSNSSNVPAEICKLMAVGETILLPLLRLHVKICEITLTTLGHFMYTHTHTQMQSVLMLKKVYLSALSLTCAITA